MWRTANHKMIVIGRCFCIQISQSSESDQSFCVFSITSTLLTSCHLTFTVFGLECQQWDKSTSHQRIASLMGMKAITPAMHRAYLLKQVQTKV